MTGTKILTITWRRLLAGGETCPRCGATEAEVDTAVTLLRQSLEPLGFEVSLVKQELTMMQFKQDTLQSNSIRINGRLLEEWLGGSTGQSVCCDVCGSNDCRTVEVKGDVYEFIPADLVVKAGMLAAAQLMGACDCANDQPEHSCCS